MQQIALGPRYHRLERKAGRDSTNSQASVRGSMPDASKCTTELAYTVRSASMLRHEEQHEPYHARQAQPAASMDLIANGHFDRLRKWGISTAVIFREAAGIPRAE